MVSGGYPEAYEKGFTISLPEKTNQALLFHAGTALDTSGSLVNQGGRVMAITGMGEGLQEALDHAYAAIDQISWKNAYFRRDIGQDILRLNK
jgi:phosphoribosylamine--glycine ligase